MAGMSNKDKLLWLAVALLLFGGAAGAAILENGVSGFFGILGAILKGVQGLLGTVAPE
jgi:hypothetical protein